MAAALGGALYSQTLGRAGSMLGASRQASGDAMAGQAGCGRKPRLAQPAPYCSSQEAERGTVCEVGYAPVRSVWASVTVRVWICV